MLSVPAGVRIWLVAGLTDMRRGIDGLSALVQTQLSAEVLSGQLFIFRGRRGDRVNGWRQLFLSDATSISFGSCPPLGGPPSVSLA